MMGIRREAKLAGHERYFTGQPCTKGHVAQRITSSGECCACRRDRYVRNLEENKRNAAEWNRTNKAPRLEIQARSRAKRAEEFNEKARQRNKTEEGRRKRRTYAKLWRQKFPEKRLERERNYRKANPKKMAVKWAVKNARRKGAPGRYFKSDIDAIRVRQKAKCGYCRTPLANVREHRDHILPICLGGTNDPSNIQLLCEPCNLRKGIKHPNDYARSLGMLL